MKKDEEIRGKYVLIQMGGTEEGGHIIEFKIIKKAWDLIRKLY